MEEANIPETPKPIPSEAKPVCPFCNLDPLVISANHFQLGPYRLLLVACARCRKIVPASLVAVARPNIVQPLPPGMGIPQRSPLVIP